MDSSNDFTQATAIPGAGSGSPFANGLLNITADASGLSPGSDEGQRFSSPSLRKSQSAETGDKNCPSILLIEDNEADVLLFQQALKEYNVRAALWVLRDGEEAVNFIEAVENQSMECPDLIVLDLNLPKKSGHDVLAKTRSSGTCSHVPVVVLSSSAVPTDTNESKRLGVARHIQKPAELEAYMRIGGVLRSFLRDQK